MTNTWLNKNLHVGSNDSLSDPQPSARPSTSTANEFNNKNDSAIPNRSPLTAFTSPHDAALAKHYGNLRTPEISNKASKSIQEREVAKNAPRSPAADDKSRSRVHLGDYTQSHSHSPHSNAVPSQPLFDPFDGTQLGVLCAPELAFHNSDFEIEAQPMGEGFTDKGEEEMWAHLSRVLVLQSEIAQKHAEMEGMGFGKVGDGKGKSKGKGKGGMTRAETLAQEAIRPRKRVASTVSQAGGDGGADEEGLDDAETEKDKAREDEFAKLADQFEDKKESINEIMSKLDSLSEALRQFHALPEPKLESSRRSTSPKEVSPDLTSQASPGREGMKSPSLGLGSNSGLRSPPTVTPILTTPIPQTQKKAVILPSSPLVNALEPDAEMVDSPISTVGSLKAEKD